MVTEFWLFYRQNRAQLTIKAEVGLTGHMPMRVGDLEAIATHVPDVDT